MNDNGKRFWSDLSKRTGTWAGAMAVGAALVEWLQQVEGEPLDGSEHWLAVVAVALVRALLGLIQGKVGDPDKASFSKADTADGEKGD